MVNSDILSKQLKILMEYYELSASAFADRINVQRSSISHLLSGRNKPSLHFVLKVLDTFPDVTWDWLLYNRGHFPKDETGSAPTLFSNMEKEKLPETTKKESNKEILSSSAVFSSNGHFIEQIIIFYTDGTFKVFNPRK